MTAIDIVNHWYAFSGYDPDQHSFNLLSSEYTFHRANDKIGEIFEYDPYGSLAAIYAKTIFLKEMADARVQLLPLIEAPDVYAEYRTMWEVFHSADMAAVEENVRDTLWNTTQRISGKIAVGERNFETEDKAIVSAVCSVIEELKKLKIDCYKRGGKLGDNLLQYVSSKITVFPTLAQCVLTLETAEDGVYLCYIRNSDTADGYFGLFIKSNGNIISFNERPDEAYIGQHKNSRNGRWTERKTYGIFPYGIFSFADYDYKEYSTVHKIDDNRLSFSDISANEYFPTILAIVLLAQRYGGQEGIGKDVYIDSLLSVNMKQVEDATQKVGVLIPIAKENSAIVAANTAFKLDFTQEDVVTGAVNETFNYANNKGAPYDESGTFPEQSKDSYAQLLIDLYGDGFELDVADVLRSNSSLRMLPPSEEGGENSLALEFVGTSKRLQMEAYRRARGQLARHIQKNMLEEYKVYGGLNAVNEWWTKAMLTRRDFIEALCVELYLQNNVSDAPATLDGKPNEISLKNPMGLCAYCVPDTKGAAAEKNLYQHVHHDNMPYNAEKKSINQWGRRLPEGKFLCPETGAVASIYFVFHPKTWKDLEKLAGCEVPKIVKGWAKNGTNDIYTGNPLLDATDMVWGVETPLQALEHSYGEGKKYADLNMGDNVDFCIGIAWSKRGWNRVLNRHKKCQEASNEAV